MFRVLFFLVGSAGTLVSAAFLLGLVLTVTGSPDGCRNTSVHATSEGATVAERKWREFGAALVQDGVATITLTEQEVTGRANRWIEERHLPVTDLRVYFCSADRDHPKGQGQVTASIGQGPVSTTVLVDATLDTRVEGDAIRIIDVRAGNLPGFATGWAESRVQDIVRDAAVDFEENVTEVTFADGEITLKAER